MASSTPTIKLTLPATSEKYSITVLNSNFTKIDTAVADLQADIDSVSNIIDDSVRSEASTYSSEYISAEFADVRAVLNGKLSSVPQASMTTLGGIKLYGTTTGGVLQNKSGLYFASGGNGGLYVATRDGVKLNGAGQVTLNPATQDEVRSGINAVKAVTPATLAEELNERITTPITEASGGMFVTLDELAEAGVYPDRRSSFTKIPEEIGLWDGNLQIWRVAIDKSLVSADFERGYYSLTNDDLGVVDRTKITIIINGSLRRYSPAPLLAFDSINCEIGDALKVALSGNPEYRRLIGYVEFTTNASNIKS